jgi:parallel beta-helix repeat protein
MRLINKKQRRKAMKMFLQRNLIRFIVVSVFAVLMLTSAMDGFSQVSVPYTFKADTKAVASEVNANFQALVDAINSMSPAQRIVVAKSGGDYTTITDALNAINPSESNPYLIEVMPGKYKEHVSMKSYVHLRGAGRDVTTIEWDNGFSCMDVKGQSNLGISGFTFSNGGIGMGIDCDSASSSVTIINNAFVDCEAGIYSSMKSSIICANLFENNNTGISNQTDASDIVIIGNTITGNSYGITNWYCTPIIIGNVISDNTGDGIRDLYSTSIIKDNIIINNGADGVHNRDSDSFVTNNTIFGNGGYGIYIWNSSPKVLRNEIITNTSGDVELFGVSSPFIGFNTYETLNGTPDANSAYNIDL